jgi:hypothetical protein
MEWEKLRPLIYSKMVSAEGPLYAFIAVVVVLGALWLVTTIITGSGTADLRRRLERAEALNSQFARVFRGRSIEEVATRMRALERYLDGLPPRVLSEEQSLRLASMGVPPLGASYLAVVYDNTVAEAKAYAAAFIEALGKAPGWNVVDHKHPRLAKLAEGIAVGLAEPGHPSPAELQVLGTLREAGIDFGVVQRSTPGMHAQIVISAR